MAKEKICARATTLEDGTRQGIFYNFDDMNCFNLDNLEWMGGKWLDNSMAAIREEHKKFKKDYKPMTKEDFDDFVKKLKTVGDDFGYYLEECELSEEL